MSEIVFDHGFVFASRRTANNKVEEHQIGTHFTPGADGGGWNPAWGETYAGTWSDYAIPVPPVQDAAGNVSSGLEVIVAHMGDDIKEIGQRDVRWEKYRQDGQAGDSGKVNAFGSRLALHKNAVSLTTSTGASLNFDIKGNTVLLSGFPNSSRRAAYVTIGLTSVGLVSPSGAASVNVSDKGVTVNGKAATLSAGKVLLGLAADDPVVTAKYLMAFATALDNWIAAVITACAAGGITIPPFTSAAVVKGSTTVLASP